MNLQNLHFEQSQEDLVFQEDFQNQHLYHQKEDYVEQHQDRREEREDDFRSQNPHVWGSHYWYVMKNIAANLNFNDSYSLDAVKNYYQSLIWLLPCKLCREHYVNIYKTIDINNYLKNNETLIEWVTQIQIQINIEMQNHKFHTLTESKTINLNENNLNGNLNENNLNEPNSGIINNSGKLLPNLLTTHKRKVNRKKELKIELLNEKKRLKAYKKSRQLRNNIELQDDYKCCQGYKI
jgi:hypothetical protein